MIFVWRHIIIGRSRAGLYRSCRTTERLTACVPDFLSPDRADDRPRLSAADMDPTCLFHLGALGRPSSCTLKTRNLIDPAIIVIF